MKPKATKGTALKTKILRKFRRTAEPATGQDSGGRDGGRGNPDDGVMLTRPGGRDAGDPPVRRVGGRPRAPRSSPRWAPNDCHPGADVGDARGPPRPPPRRGASHGRDSNVSVSPRGVAGLMCTAPPHAVANVTGKPRLETTFTGDRVKRPPGPVSMNHAVHTGIALGIDGRRHLRGHRRRRRQEVRKQSGSIGETLERVRSRKAAEGRRRAALRGGGGGGGGGRLPATSPRLGSAAPRRSGGRVHAARGRVWTALVSADADLARHVTRHDPDAVAQLRRDHDASVAARARRPRRFRLDRTPAARSILVVTPLCKPRATPNAPGPRFLERALSSPQLQYPRRLRPAVPRRRRRSTGRHGAGVPPGTCSRQHAAKCDIEPSIAHGPVTRT